MIRDLKNTVNSISFPSSLPPFLRSVAEGTIIHIRVHPGAGKTTWAGAHNRELKLKVQAPAVGGAANQNCLSFLARWFRVKRSEVVLLKGEKSRSKAFLLKGLTLEKCRSLIPYQNPDQSNS
ncbi:MAG: YggU family protein [Deltaproteobacteria bacterium]|nr:YggU family protein [Deltaproteobacteria bacterium]